MSKKKIILADDDYYFVQSMKDMLEDEGFQVVTAYNFNEARGKISENSDAQVVVLDIMMPTGGESDFDTQMGYKSGQVLARWVKDKFPEINIIGMSSTRSLDINRWFEKQKIPFYLKGDFELLEGLNMILNLGEVKQLKTFIVHGHDGDSLLQLKNYLQNTLKFPEPTILRELPSLGRTIIEKFEDTARQVNLVFVLLTPDDIVNDSSTTNDIKRRARQNVIFELGYFFAKLQRNKGKVILLHKGKLDLPSDIAGIIYIDISNGIEAAGEQIRRELSL